MVPDSNALVVDSTDDGPTSDGPTSAVVDYLRLAAARDVRAARDAALAGSGGPPGGPPSLAALITGLLAPAMAETGQRWYDGRWNAAQEHIASGLTDTVLSAASVRLRDRRPPAEAPSVVLVSPQGEEHLLPARFAGELLSEAGADVIALGPPLPGRYLSGFLASVHPSALVVSCTWPLAMDGVRAAVEAAHVAGIPALAGGAGLGRDDRRARGLGADGWAATAADALTLLQSWRDQPPSLADLPPRHPEVDALDALPEEVYDRAIVGLGERGYDVDGPAAATQVRADLRLAVGATAAALVCGDERLLADLVRWAGGLHQARNVTWRAMRDALAVLHDSLPADLPDARLLLDTVS